MNWFKKLFKEYYKLSSDEKILWDSIIQKAEDGYNEYKKEYPNCYDNIIGPWIKDYTKEEYNLIDKIHDYFYPGWYSCSGGGCAQVLFEMYEDIKDKVK